MTLDCGCPYPGDDHLLDAEARAHAVALGVAGADRIGLFCPVRAAFYAQAAKRWTFRVDGVPGVKGRARHGQGRTYGETETKRYEQLVAGAAAVAGVRWSDDRAFSVHLRVWTPDRRTRDGDNIMKVILDGMQKAGAACLPDDSLRYVPDQRTTWMGVDRFRSGVEVTIRQIEPVA